MSRSEGLRVNMPGLVKVTAMSGKIGNTIERQGCQLSSYKKADSF